YSDFASLWGLEAGARISAPAPLGWCSWYQYFSKVAPDDVRANLAALAGRGFDLVQIDDGYQRAIGDWRAMAPEWEGALPGLVHDIRHAALDAGIWTAPFLAAPDSDVLRDHPFLLGCGCPFGPAVGVVDAMRVSPDVAPVWEPDNSWPGLVETAPAAVNAISASVLRAPLHRRVFINDPDCLLLRPSDTGLDARQRSFLAA